MREESVVAERLVEDYLARMEAELRGTVPATQVREIVQETRSHLLDHLERGSAADVRAALRHLGEPEQYARGFLDEEPVAETRKPPGLVRLVGQGVAGFVVLNLATLFYALALLLFAIALIELFDPASIGLWVDHDGATWSFSYGAATETEAEAMEVLGGWLIVIGLSGALAVYAGTTFLVRRWLARRERPVARSTTKTERVAHE